MEAHRSPQYICVRASNVFTLEFEIIVMVRQCQQHGSLGEKDAAIVACLLINLTHAALEVQPLFSEASSFR